MKILFTAFNGKENSSKLLLDKINSNNKLYLKNSYITSVKQLEKEIKKNNYDLIISFGQACLEKDTVQIETKGILEKEYKTKYDYKNLENKLKEKYKVKISSFAGKYYCNNIYYNGLKIITEESLKTNMIFIHIPLIKNITDINILASIFNDDNI